MSYAVGCGLHQIDIRSSSPASSPVAGSAPTIPPAVTRTQATGSFAPGLEDNGPGSNNNTAGTDNFNSNDNDNSNNQATGLRFFPPPRDEHETIQRIRLWHSISIVRLVSSHANSVSLLLNFLSKLSYHPPIPFSFDIFDKPPHWWLFHFSFRVVCPPAGIRPRHFCSLLLLLFSPPP